MSENSDIETQTDIEALQNALAIQKMENEKTRHEWDAAKNELDEQLNAYALEVASRRGYERTVGLVMTIAAGLAIGVGILFSFLGLNELNKLETRVTAFDIKAGAIEAGLDKDIADFKKELETTIDDKIALSFKNDDAKSKSYVEHLRRIGVLITSLSTAEGRWQEINKALVGLENSNPDADLKGEYLSILKANESAESEQDKPSRAAQVGIALRIAQHLKQAKANPEFALQFTADDIFNAAQFARHLERPDIEAELVNAAFELDKTSASIRAQYLQLQAKDPRKSIRDEHFSDLMGMLDRLTLDSPHIVVAEAWNAAEELRRYTDLIEALDALIAKLDTDSTAVVPSTAFAIKGNAHQRRGHPGELLVATKSYVDAIERLALEGTHTQWSKATISNTLQGTQELLFSGVDISAILAAADRSGVRPLQLRLEPFKLFAQ